MKKIIYFLSHPIQYQSPLLQKIANEQDMDFTVCYFTDHTIGGIDRQFGKKITWDVPLLEGYKYVFLKNYASNPAVSGKFWGLINWGIIRYLIKERPNYIVVHGWAYFSNLLLLGTAKILGIKVIMRAESPLKQDRRSGLKKIILNHFVDRALYIGEENKKFYLSYGLPESKLFYGPYCVDNQRFISEYTGLAPRKVTLKSQMGIDDSDVVILFLGKYIAKKQPMDVIRAFNKLSQNNLRLIMVGEGELRARMQEYILNNNLEERVTLTGFINQSEISQYYCVADVFVLPSGRGETWGLVLNEAMNFHLPLVVSDMVGSSDDLVHEADNGYTYRYGNIDELVEKLKILVDNTDLRTEFGEKSAEIVCDYAYEKVVDGLKRAIA